MNRLTHPGEKRMVQYAKKEAKQLPKDFEKNVESLLQNLFVKSEEVTDTLQKMIAALQTCLEHA